MEAKATARYVRVAPRKARVMVNMIRGKYADEALEQLQFTSRRAAVPVAKALKSALASAKDRFDVDPEALVVSEAWVDKGPTLKRFMPRARGMATRIDKMTSHITIVVAEDE